FSPIERTAKSHKDLLDCGREGHGGPIQTRRVCWCSVRNLEDRYPFKHPTVIARHRMSPAMKTLRTVLGMGLLIGLVIEVPDRPATAQNTSPKESQTPAAGLRKLAGDDARRAAELDQAIAVALTADRWDEAIVKAQELLALRAKIQGPKHFETVNA